MAAEEPDLLKPLGLDGVWLAVDDPAVSADRVRCKDVLPEKSWKPSQWHGSCMLIKQINGLRHSGRLVRRRLDDEDESTRWHAGGAGGAHAGGWGGKRGAHPHARRGLLPHGRAGVEPRRGGCLRHRVADLRRLGAERRGNGAGRQVRACRQLRRCQRLLQLWRPGPGQHHARGVDQAQGCRPLGRRRTAGPGMEVSGKHHREARRLLPGHHPPERASRVLLLGRKPRLAGRAGHVPV